MYQIESHHIKPNNIKSSQIKSYRNQTTSHHIKLNQIKFKEITSNYSIIEIKESACTVQDKYTFETTEIENNIRAATEMIANNLSRVELGKSKVHDPRP